MAKSRKITQNINKDAGLMDLPKVYVDNSKWSTPVSNYITSNIGDIVPIYVDEVLPGEKRHITMGMLSHMTTPIAPIFNAQYTEFRSFFIPYRLCADLLGGYSTRKSPWVKVFGEDNASASADIIVPLANQKLPSVHTNLLSDFVSHLETYGGVADALDYDTDFTSTGYFPNGVWTEFNFLDMAAYELVYQFRYRNENRESATESNLYKWLFNLYNRTSVGGIYYDDKFHIANREKDYYTGCNPFTQKSNTPISVGLVGQAPVSATTVDHVVSGEAIHNSPVPSVADSSKNFRYVGVAATGGASLPTGVNAGDVIVTSISDAAGANSFSLSPKNLWADLSASGGVDIESLRLMIKTQELLEKDAMYGSKYIESLNAHFGTAPMSLVLEEPLELKKVTISSQMQPVFQSSSTSGESTILGTIGANVTTQSGNFEIVPNTEFKEYGLLMICAVHKAQNSYDARHYKPKRIYKKSRFDFYVPELNDLGFQPVSRLEFSPDNVSSSLNESVGYNEAWAEYRYKSNRVHGMFEPSRANALDYWTLAISNVADVQTLYKQSTTELDRAISVSSANAPQFFDAYGFIEINDKPMKLHSIPGMDGVI